MRELADKFAALEREIAEQRGDFTLFALFLREDAENKWDVIVSAPWFGGDERNVLDYLVQKIQSRLRPDELVTLSRIVPIEPNNEAVKAVNKSINVEHGMVEVLDSDFFGLQIKHAYIITSRERDLVSSPAALS
jgi:hypothetical protein